MACFDILYNHYLVYNLSLDYCSNQFKEEEDDLKFQVHQKKEDLTHNFFENNLFAMMMV